MITGHKRSGHTNAVHAAAEDGVVDKPSISIDLGKGRGAQLQSSGNSSQKAARNRFPLTAASDVDSSLISFNFHVLITQRTCPTSIVSCVAPHTR